ncbi:hypothetical protein D3C73_573260 [compost metagenome]
MTQYFNNLAFGRRTSFRITDDANYNLLAVRRPIECAFRNENIFINPLIIGNNKAVYLIVLKHTNDLGHGTLNNTDNLTLELAAPTALGRDSAKNDISIHRTLQIVSMNIYIGMLPVLGNQKGEPFGMHLKTAAQQTHPLRHTIAVGLGQEYLPFPLQLIKKLEELLEICSTFYTEMLLQFLIGHGFIGGLPHKI